MVSRYEHFAFLISCIYRQIQKIERDEMVRYGIRGAYAQYLAAISRYPNGITAAQLCEVCDRDKAAISRALTDMEARELIVRCNANDTTYRAVIRLTEEGKRLASIVAERAAIAVEKAGEGLTEDERGQFYAAMELIASNLHQLERDGIPQMKQKEGGQ